MLLAQQLTKLDKYEFETFVIDSLVVLQIQHHELVIYSIALVFHKQQCSCLQS